MKSLLPGLRDLMSSNDDPLVPIFKDLLLDTTQALILVRVSWNEVNLHSSNVNQDDY